VLHNFRLRTPKGTPKGSSDLWSHPVLLLRKKRGKKPGMRGTYFRSGPFPELRIPKGTPKGSSDLWSHPVLLLRKKRGKKPGMRRTYFRYGTLPERASSGHVTVTSGQKAPLGRIWRNFRLRMRRIYFRIWSFPVT
jgi:hypothetical protein